MLLGWLLECQKAGIDPSSLRYIFRASIISTDTNNVINTLVSNLPQWPGVTYLTLDWQGQALLGSPNGRGIGWMLLQHQGTFGNKKVQSVQVWKGSDGFPSILFTLGEEEDPQEPDAYDFGWEGPDGEPLQLDPNTKGNTRRFWKGEGRLTKNGPMEDPEWIIELIG